MPSLCRSSEKIGEHGIPHLLCKECTILVLQLVLFWLINTKGKILIWEDNLSSTTPFTTISVLWFGDLYWVEYILLLEYKSHKGLQPIPTHLLSPSVECEQALEPLYSLPKKLQKHLPIQSHNENSILETKLRYWLDPIPRWGRIFLSLEVS